MHHIHKQIQDKNMYKSWEQKCLHKMDKTCELIAKDYHSHLSDYYNHEKNCTKWRDELEQRKNKLHDHTRQISYELLAEKKKKLVKISKNLAIGTSEVGFKHFGVLNSFRDLLLRLN